MTTTGDLFINIKGNNQGLKRSLNQSSRDIKQFAGQSEKAMKQGLGFADVAAIAGASNIGKIFGAGQTLRQANRYRREGTWSDAMTIVRQQRQTSTMLESRRRHAAFDGDIRGYRSLSGMAAENRAQRRQTINTLKERRNKERAARQMLRPSVLLMGAVGAIAAVTGTILASNGAKWAKRINESAMSYSGAAIGNQARIDAANMRKDIQLARQNAGSAVFRQNAANFRKNSGAGGNVANYIGGAYDAAVGLASNAVFGIPGLIMNFKQVSDTIGGPK